MTLPTIVPAPFDGTTKDFLKVKCDRSGAMRLQAQNVSVPSGTVVTTIVGLVPLRRGDRIDVGATKIYSAALGTSVTASVGIIYDDTTNNTSIPALFASGSTAVAAGGEIPLLVNAATMQNVATGDGWLAVTLAGATTGTTGVISAQVASVYDGINVTN